MHLNSKMQFPKVRQDMQCLSKQRPEGEGAEPIIPGTRGGEEGTTRGPWQEGGEGRVARGASEVLTELHLGAHVGG